MAAGALIVAVLGAIPAVPALATAIVTLAACGFALACFALGKPAGPPSDANDVVASEVAEVLQP